METSGKGKAEVLNDQYSSVYSNEDLTSMPELGPSPYSAMSHINVRTKRVVSLLQKLNPKKAIGPELVPTRILKDFAEDIASMLQNIFQKRG